MIMRNENDSIAAYPIIDERLSRLKEKGARFKLCSYDAAHEYLVEKCCAFKTIAYDKLFDTYVGGKNDGKFIDLDFGYLKYLAELDQKLREILLDMALDIEHFCKTRLLAKADCAKEDGYAIMVDYQASLAESQLDYIEREKNKREDDPYCGAILKKYGDAMPIWAFAEVMPFGTLVGLVKYCAKRWDDETMNAHYYVLRSVQSLRNACAHSSCILLNLEPQKDRKRTAPPEVSKAVAAAGIPKRLRSRWLQVTPVAQAASLIYLYRQIVPSGGTYRKRANALEDFFKQIEEKPVIPMENPAMAALSFIKRLTQTFGLLN